MPALTRRCDPHVPQECWRYYDDVVVGTIARCAAPRWQRRCGFYPGSRPGECTSGTAAHFDEAGADFETAWRVFLAKRAQADFRPGGVNGIGPSASARRGLLASERLRSVFTRNIAAPQRREQQRQRAH